MGTINYKTSDYITLGVNCNSLQNTEEELWELQADFEDIQEIISKEYFHYFHIKVDPGYYEGFYIDIEFNFKYCLDSWQDRQEAQKEITSIKKLLFDLIEWYGLRACSPGWCTTYYNHAETVERVEQAIQEMRCDVKHVPTWEQVRRAEALCF